jgi:hypothetical protein
MESATRRRGSVSMCAPFVVGTEREGKGLFVVGKQKGGMYLSIFAVIWGCVVAFVQSLVAVFFPSLKCLDSRDRQSRSRCILAVKGRLYAWLCFRVSLGA